MNVDDQMVPRTNLLGEFRISDSSERRRRREGGDWPPHVLVGKKIYYRRSAIDTWLRRQEAKCQALQPVSVADVTSSSLHHRAKELADDAHPLSARQGHPLQSLFADSAEVAGNE